MTPFPVSAPVPGHARPFMLSVLDSFRPHQNTHCLPQKGLEPWEAAYRRARLAGPPRVHRCQASPGGKRVAR